MKRGRGRSGTDTIDAPRHARPEPVAQAPSDLAVRPGGSRIGERLVAAGLATQQEIEAALAQLPDRLGVRLGRLLVERGAIAEADLARVLADQHGAPTVDLRVATPTKEAIEAVAEDIARRLTLLPIDFAGDTLRVVLADPTPEAVAEAGRLIGRPLAVSVAAPQDITAAIGANYRALAGVESRVQDFETRDKLRRDAARLETATVNDEAPVVQVVQAVITQGLRDRASDIHIEPSDERVRVRFRVDGALHDVVDLPGSIGPAVVSRIKILAGMNIVERRRPQDGQISLQIDGRDVDIRVATTAVVGGEKVVMRLLDKTRPLYELGQLGMPEEIADTFERLLRSPYGMVICAGPTGSGKTTTLYTALSELNSPERNIMTIEDPVEYTFPTINQIQINEGAGVTFANGLRSILRQDPDVILVGEVRDVDTARIAVQSALTGHFVLSSLHATDTISALHRLLDMGIESFLVASSVTAVVAQRLVRRVCTHCRESFTPPPEELAFVRAFGGSIPADGFVRGAGCNFCAQTGYLDRIGVYELMPISDEIRELILDRGSHEDLRKVCRAQGLRSLQEESMRLIEAGITTPAEVMRTVYVAGS
ncbi:MAG TPA: GspE/PulE family protein [Jatrophihabitans sp.]|nr:GspE/PulE family protein [Jatrophihabitans sp.]